MASKSLLEGPLLFSTLRFCLPLVLAMIGHGLFNLVDVFLVGRLSPEAVAGVHLGSVVNFVPMILCNGIGVATVAYLSRSAGRKDHAAVQQKLASRSLWLTVFLGVLLGVLGYVLCLPTIHWLRTSENVVPLAKVYLDILSLGTLSMFLLFQVSAIFRAVGDSFWPMLLLLGGNVFNFLLNLVLIFGWGPFPRLEVAGSAWATVIARGVFGLIGLWVLWRRGHVHFSFGPWKEGLDQCKKLLNLGWPSGVQLFSRTVSVLGLTSLVQFFDHEHGGNFAAAAYGVGVRLDMLAIFAVAGWGSGASTLIGMNLGAGQDARASRAAWLVVGLASAMMVLVGAFYVLFAENLFRLFIDHPHAELLKIGADYLHIMAFAYVFLAINIVLSSAFQGAGMTRLPLILDTLSFVAILYPLSSWVIDDFGLKGVWWTVVGVNCVLAGVYALCFNQGHWKKQQLD